MMRSTLAFELEDLRSFVSVLPRNTENHERHENHETHETHERLERHETHETRETHERDNMDLFRVFRGLRVFRGQDTVFARFALRNSILQTRRARHRTEVRHQTARRSRAHPQAE